MNYREQAKWYVYHLVDPRNGEVFYVGKGTGSRASMHESEVRGMVKAWRKNGVDVSSGLRRNKRWKRIHDIWDGGERVQKYIVAMFWDELDAFKCECEQITVYASTLTNAAPGRVPPRLLPKLQMAYTPSEAVAGLSAVL